jgi:membrane peptidoglycan carboxypeptidase
MKSQDHKPKHKKQKKNRGLPPPVAKPIAQLRRVLHPFYQRLWKKRRRWQRALLILSTLLLIGGIYVYQWLFVDLPDIDDLESGQALPSTRIYDRNGKLLYEIVDLYG